MAQWQMKFSLQSRAPLSAERHCLLDANVSARAKRQNLPMLPIPPAAAFARSGGSVQAASVKEV